MGYFWISINFDPHVQHKILAVIMNYCACIDFIVGYSYPLPTIRYPIVMPSNYGIKSRNSTDPWGIGGGARAPARRRRQPIAIRVDPPAVPSAAARTPPPAPVTRNHTYHTSDSHKRANSVSKKRKEVENITIG